MPGTMITETFRKRRMSDHDEEGVVASKRSKVAPDAPPVPDTFTLLDMPSEAATCLGGMEVQSSSDHKVADMYTWRRKENRSPNLSMLDLLHEELSVSDDIVHPAEQATLIETPPAAAAHSSEGLLNLLLLADSSLHDTSSEEAESASEQDCNDSEQESGSEHDDDSKQDGDSYRQTASGTHDQEPSHTSADAAFNKRPTAAGLRPKINSQVASMMSISIDVDSDSSSDEEEEDPAPVKKHKGMGRYGQDLYNTASLALRQTNLLKKKCANRTTKTSRQMRNAKEHSCEAAQAAVEATKAAEKAVQNLARFADAFDDLVKEAVLAANAAAQSRADYAASVVAADMAEAMRDRVVSKRGKRRSTSPRTSKKMSWAADEHLVQERVFSKVDPPSAASVAHTVDSSTAA